MGPENGHFLAGMEWTTGWRYRLLICYMALLQTRVNNGDSKWRLNKAKAQVTTMGKIFVGACFGKLMLRMNRNRQYIPE